MGNVCGSAQMDKPHVVKLKKSTGPLTFGKDATLDRKDYILSNLREEVVTRDTINGQQFVVEECHNCTILLLDHIATIQVDACENCFIVIGPCESSVFLRDCKNCTIVCATQQLRLRNCNHVQLSLLCATEPIIESSNDINIGCFGITYFSLAQHMTAAKLSIWNNKWSEVYDFTPSSAGNHHNSSNWKSLPYGTTSTYDSFCKNASYPHAATLSWVFENEPKWTIPYTLGVHVRHQGQDGFYCTHDENTALSFVHRISTASPTVHIVQTREMQLTSPQVEKLFPSMEAAIRTKFTDQLIVGMHLIGNLSTLHEISIDEEALRQSELFFTTWKVIV